MTELPNPTDDRSEDQRQKRFPDLPPLSPATRVLLLCLGWLLIGVGLIGLLLPGIQGVLTLLFGGAVLSLVSWTMLRWLRLAFARWPRGWRRLLQARRRVHQWLEKRQ